MFLYKILILTLVLFLILNFSKLRRGIFQWRDLILPFSLSFAASIVDTFIRTAFVISILAFILLFAVCFGILHFVAATKK